MDASKFQPRGKWVLIKRVDDSKTELALPDSVRQGMQSKTQAVVHVKGKDCGDDYEEGATIIVNPTGAISIDAKNGWLLAHDEAILAIVH